MEPFQNLYDRDVHYAELVPRGTPTGSGMVAFAWVVIMVALTMVLCRIYTRGLRQRSLGFDDAFIVFAMALSIGAGVCNIFQLHYGFGRHMWQLDQRQRSGAIEWLYISVLINYISLCFVRLSIGIFILRLLQVTHFKLRVVIYGAMTINSAVTIMIVVVYALYCRPIQGVWDTNVKAKCLSGNFLNDVNRAFAGVSAALDLLFTFIPVTVVWKLQLGVALKINTTIFMGFGLVTATCAILKAIYDNIESSDVTYATVKAGYCAIAEGNCGIIAACLPAMRQFFLITRDDILRLMGRKPISKAKHISF